MHPRYAALLALTLLSVFLVVPTGDAGPVASAALPATHVLSDASAPFAESGDSRPARSDPWQRNAQFGKRDVAEPRPLAPAGSRAASESLSDAKRALLPANVRPQFATERAAQVLPEVGTTGGAAASSRGVSCVCGLDIEGQDFCFADALCGGLTPCTSSVQCGRGERCVANTCCAPPEDFACHSACSGGCVGGGVCGSYEVCTPSGPPANDDCAFAESIFVGSASGTTVEATPDTAPICDGVGSGTPGVWYSVIGTGNTMIASTCSEFNTNPDTKISVYCGGCDVLACAAAIDDACSGVGNSLLSTVNWCSQAGVEYLILVHDFSATSGSGAFTLSIGDTSTCNTPPNCGPPVEGDTCDDALVIPGVPFTTTFDNSAAGNSPPTGSCNSVGADGMDNAVWYTYTPVIDCELSVTVDPDVGAGYDGMAAVHEGPDCLNLTELMCLDEPEPILGSVSVTAGTTYWIQMGDWGAFSGGGVTQLDVDCLPMSVCCNQGVCADGVLQDACLTQQGTWFDGVDCAGFTCPEACCSSTGGCSMSVPEACVETGGSPQGAGSTCATVTCGPVPCGQSPFPECGGDCPSDSICTGSPTGGSCACQAISEACCPPNLDCADIPPAECRANNGIARGPGTNCTTTPCPQSPQACCFPDVTCTKVLTGSCTAACPCNPDMNCDGALNSSDILPFETAMVDPTTYQNQFPLCVLDWADVDCDGDIDELDWHALHCLLGIGEPTECMHIDPVSCTSHGGTPLGTNTVCSIGLEACCSSSDGACRNRDPLCCALTQGSAQGSGTVCGDSDAACCLGPDCVMVDPQCCDDVGGLPSPIGEPVCLQDNNSDGVDDACESPPTGACCDRLTFVCQDDELAIDCISTQQTWHQDLLCSDPNVSCAPPLQACCLRDGSCEQVTPAACQDRRGTPQGASSICTSVTCPQPFVEIDRFEETTALVQLVGGPLGPVPVSTILRGPSEAHVFFEGSTEGDADDDDGNLREEVDTELVSMNLTDGAITLSVNPARASVGQIEELVNNISGTLDIDPFAPGNADSFFDVFFQIDVGGGLILHNEQALRIASVISHKPPSARYNHILPPGGPLELFDASGSPTGIFIVKAAHYTGFVEIDTFDVSWGEMELIAPTSPSELIQVAGQNTVAVYFERGEGQAEDDSDASGLDEVETEMLSLNLTGTSSFGSVNVRLHPNIRSLGLIEERTNNTPGTLDVFPFTPTGAADSFFDIFFEIDVGGLFLYTRDPKRMSSVIHSKPPGPGDIYESPQTIPLYDASGNPTGYAIGAARHEPNPGEACCSTSGGCNMSLPEACIETGGSPQGGGSTCATATCGPVPCDQSPFPACGGACPAGLQCTPSPLGGACSCEPILCEDTYPACGGACPPGTGCESVGSDTVVVPSPQLPPESNSPDCNAVVSMYVGDGVHARFPNGVDFSNPIHRCFQNVQRQDDGLGNEIETFDSTMEATVDDGTGSRPIMLTGPVQVIVYGKTGNATGTFATEMVSMSLTGDVGGLAVEIRESPSLAATGQTTITDLGGGLWQIDSFFDVFTELSVDGGAFQPQISGPARMVLQPVDPATCECVPDQVPCGQGDPTTCNGICTNSAEICTPDPSGGPCSCQPLNCEPNASGTACNGARCPDQSECNAQCVVFDPATGARRIVECECRNSNECHVELPGVARGVAPCTVVDTGAGTVTLPPQGCAYLSPDEVHEIIDGLPPGTTIELDAIHKDFICDRQNDLCSTLLPPGECEGTGGTLGGHGDCFESTLEIILNGTGALAGFNRILFVPVFSEVHTGPRNPGDPVQSFSTDMVRLQGELFGDPDFCTLKVTGGTGAGMPSPGQTTLTKLPSGDFNVDSFFDITYQIEFTGCPGSQLEGLSGVTTATIRMRAVAGIEPPTCTGVCPPGTECRRSATPNVDGTITVCCDCVIPEPPAACCLPDGVCEDLTVDECDRRNGFSRGSKTSCQLAGDLDADGGVSLSDWSVFAPCMGGPATPAGLGCARADLNCDGFVDLRDARIFQVQFGP